MVTALVSIAAGAHAEPFSKQQVACALGLQAAGDRVARVVTRRFLGCVGVIARAKGSATTCLVADPGKRLARARAKIVTFADKRCATPPPIGPRDAITVADALTDALRSLELFGADLDRAMIKRIADAPGARCQAAVARGLTRLTLTHLTTFRSCLASALHGKTEPTAAALSACVSSDPHGRLAREQSKIERLAMRACRNVDLATAFDAGCRGDAAGTIVGCVAAEARCGTCLALDRAGELSASCAAADGFPAGALCHRIEPPSVARQWDETMLSAIRIDLPRPPVHARNLFHLSVVMWDAWAAYDPTAAQYAHHERRTAADVAADRAATISYAAHRLLRERFANSPNAAASLQAFDARMTALGYDTAYDSTTDDTPAALGNRIAATVIAAALADGSNEAGNFADPTYTAVNEPLVVKMPGTTMVDPNRWQPLALDVQIGQNGIPIPGKIQVYVGPQWDGVLPFALTRPDSSVGYLDPGLPPMFGGATDTLAKEHILDMLRKASTLTVDDGATIDISPASLGANPLGTNDGHGYPLNPSTAAPYVPEVVTRGDFTRVLAEFWADGPTSETPPGHWNVIANTAGDHPALVRRVGGTGPIVDRLEWDVKLYIAINGALHDAAVQCWGTKRRYDSVRPISAIRYLGGKGQSSNPGGPSYDPAGLPLEDGLVEVVTTESSAPGQRHANLAGHVGEIAVLSWPGQPADPATEHSGVQWVRAVEWLPYQRSTFVTPAFPAFTSGHSTFSRSAAEVLARFTGDPYFPAGLSEYVIVPGFLQFENGPSAAIRLQWATYFDAADQAGQSRLYGGIHTSADDFGGRIAGATIGPQAYDKAVTYFTGAAVP